MGKCLECGEYTFDGPNETNKNGNGEYTHTCEDCLTNCTSWSLISILNDKINELLETGTCCEPKSGKEYIEQLKEYSHSLEKRILELEDA